MAKQKDTGKNKKQAQSKPGFFKRVANWFKDIKAEMHRVNWTDRKKLKLNTGTVLAIILVIAIMIFVFDFAVSTILSKTGFYTGNRKPAATNPTTVTETTDGDVETTTVATTTANE